MKRPCIEDGCPVLTRKTRCVEHERAKDRVRGSAAARGYGVEHQALRAAWKRRMEADERVVCWRCRDERGVEHDIDPESFDLGHDDSDRSLYRGPECVSGNRATAARHMH